MGKSPSSLRRERIRLIKYLISKLSDGGTELDGEEEEDLGRISELRLMLQETQEELDLLLDLLHRATPRPRVS
jgi:hypothetical protein